MENLNNNTLNTIWTIKSEFSSLTYQKVNSNPKFIGFIDKWIKIMLLRDNRFFKSIFSDDEYNEFIDKINKYKNKYGESNYNISLYFSEYNFSECLADKILTIRNQYGIILLFMLAYPYDLFQDDLFIFSQELKKISNNFNLRNLLQEISFDLGCSSYAIGKFYDYLNKIYDNNQNYSELYDLSDLEFESYCLTTINLIKSMIQVFNYQNNKYNLDEQELINSIKNKQKDYLPLDFEISNRILIYFFKIFFKI